MIIRSVKRLSKRLRIQKRLSKLCLGQCSDRRHPSHLAFSFLFHIHITSYYASSGLLCSRCTFTSVDSDYRSQNSNSPLLLCFFRWLFLMLFDGSLEFVQNHLSYLLSSVDEENFKDVTEEINLVCHFCFTQLILFLFVSSCQHPTSQFSVHTSICYWAKLTWKKILFSLIYTWFFSPQNSAILCPS